MKKLLILVFVFLLVFSLTACDGEAVLPESKVYEVSGDIHSLKVQINAADFTIVEAEIFSVESNLKNLTVSDENGVLTIKEEGSFVGTTYTDAELILSVPSGMVFDEISISTGAAKLTADSLAAATLKLELGAGNVEIGKLAVTSNTEIRGGAGKITISDGYLQNLKLEMGTGALKLTAALNGSSDLKLGVGAANLTLLGGKDRYKVEIEKGLGSITVDGESVSDFGSSGDGANAVTIEGGVGSIVLNFQ